MIMGWAVAHQFVLTLLRWSLHCLQRWSCKAAAIYSACTFLWGPLSTNKSPKAYSSLPALIGIIDTSCIFTNACYHAESFPQSITGDLQTWECMWNRGRPEIIRAWSGEEEGKCQAGVVQRAQEYGLTWGAVANLSCLCVILLKILSLIDSQFICLMEKAESSNTCLAAAPVLQGLGIQWKSTQDPCTSATDATRVKGVWTPRKKDALVHLFQKWMLSFNFVPIIQEFGLSFDWFLQIFLLGLS